MVASVVSEASGPSQARPPLQVEYPARPMVYVVRYCGAQPSSISAAVGQAILVLDGYLRQVGSPVARQLYVIYRNHIEGAVTVQVGYPVSEEAAAAVTGEISAGTSPAGLMVELCDEKTLQQILAVGLSLPESSASYTWQIFEQGDFRPWSGRLVERLLVPAEFWPYVQGQPTDRAGQA